MAKSFTTLDEARYLANGGYTSGVANRLYYACFYAVSALLLSEGESSSKHSGIMSMFDRLWVKPHRIPAEKGAFYHLMFQQRQKGDYEDMFSFDNTELAIWVMEAQDFVQYIQTFLQNSIGL